MNTTPLSYSPALLTNGNPNAQPQYMLGQPALANNGMLPMPQKPALAQRPPIGQPQAPQGATGNARGSSRMPIYPDQKIGLPEGLIRVGGSIVGASANGGLAAFQAGTDAYGGIMDYNRARELEKFQAEEARRIEEQRRQDLLRKMSGRGGKGKGKNGTQDDAAQIAKLEGILNDLRNDSNLTGPIAGSIGHQWDRSGYGDPKRAAKRLILAELQVNATLAYTAQTKGAITDREMALFAKPVPTLTDDEGVWIEWLEPQLEVLRQLQRNGITDEAAKAKGIQIPNSSNTPGPNASVDDLLNTYAPNK